MKSNKNDYLNTYKPSIKSHHVGIMAFTLIELMAVIAIIMIMAGLAIGGINVALQRARQVHSVNNMRQISISLNTYANENNDFYPSGKTSARENLSLLFAYKVTKNIFQARSDKGLTNTINFATNTLLPGELSYGYMSGLSGGDHPMTPLLIERVAGTLKQDNSNITTNSLWGGEGVNVLHLDGSVRFVRADNTRTLKDLYQTPDATNSAVTPYNAD